MNGNNIKVKTEIFSLVFIGKLPELIVIDNKNCMIYLENPISQQSMEILFGGIINPVFVIILTIDLY